MLRHLCTVAVLLATLTACGGSSEPGPEGDVEMTPVQIEEQAKAADTPTLEQTVADYKAAIQGKKAELEGLQEELEAQAGKTLGDALDMLGGDATKGDEIAGDYEAMKAKLAALQSDLEALKTKMTIYADELASR